LRETDLAADGRSAGVMRPKIDGLASYRKALDDPPRQKAGAPLRDVVSHPHWRRVHESPALLPKPRGGVLTPTAISGA
jgi:hypothetical protein